MEPIVIAMIVGIAVSLILGVKSYYLTQELQTKQFKHAEKLQQREHRHARLNEIVGWASEIAKNTVKLDGKSFTVEDAVSFSGFEARSQYMRDIASMFGEELVTTVDDVTKNIRSGMQLVFVLIKHKEVQQKLLVHNPWLQETSESDDIEQQGEVTLGVIRVYLYKSATELMSKVAKVIEREILSKD